MHKYLDQFKCYFEAKDLTNNVKKRAILLNAIGQKHFHLIKDLCQPSAPGSKSFKELTQLLRHFHEHQPLKFLQRAGFDKRICKPGKSIQSYIVEPRSISDTINLETHFKSDFMRSFSQKLIMNLFKGNWCHIWKCCCDCFILSTISSGFTIANLQPTINWFTLSPGQSHHHHIANTVNHYSFSSSQKTAQKNSNFWV